MRLQFIEMNLGFQKSQLFVGRHDEINQFVTWVSGNSNESPTRASLVIGSAGIGKSTLLRKFQEICQAHNPAEPWYAQLVAMNVNESPSALLERILIEAYSILKGTFVRIGPSDDQIKAGLLKVVPKVGELLTLLIGDKKRPGWERFVVYLEAISKALEKVNGRFVVMIDPERTMQASHCDEWFSVARRIPESIRLIIAQRPDDVIASDHEFSSSFISIPHDKYLRELDKKAVSTLYELEFQFGRLKIRSTDWATEIRERLAERAFQRYGGYPFAHDAIVRLLITKEIGDPVAEIESWPTEVENLLNMLFASLCKQGDERRDCALALQVFSFPTPLVIWSRTAGVSDASLSSALYDARFRHFFEEVAPDFYVPFHALFAERLDNELDRLPDSKLRFAEAAWKAIEPGLCLGKGVECIPESFSILVATNVVSRFSDGQRLLDLIGRLSEPKLRRGFLDALEADHEYVLKRFGPENELIRAAALANIGVARRSRGDFKGSKKLFEDAIEIYEQQDCEDGIAINLGNLGVALQHLGESGPALEAHQRALTLDKKLGKRDRLGIHLGNIGVILAKNGDLDGATKHYEEATDIFREQGQVQHLATLGANLSRIFLIRGAVGQAESLIREAIVGAERFGDIHDLGTLYGNLASVQFTKGDPKEAVESLGKAIEIDSEMGRLEGVARHSGNAGLILIERGDLDQAEDMLRQSEKINIQNGDRGGLAGNYGNLGIIYDRRGDNTYARELYHKALVLFEEINEPEGAATQCGNLGVLAAKQRNFAEARKWLIRAGDIFSEIGAVSKSQKAQSQLDSIKDK